ncbi:MAG: NAD(P)/FAD-dependent oxidoreductase [Nostocoides sp.]
MSVDAQQVDIVIIGGGIAGLSAAWTLRDHNVLLLEQRSRFGGRIKSVRHGDYWANVGAQMFPGDETRIGQLALELGLPAIPIPGVIHGVAVNDRIYAPKRMEAMPLVLPLTLKERFAFARAGLRLQSGVRRYHKVAARGLGDSDVDFRQRVITFESERTFAEFLGPLPGVVDGLFRNVARRTVAEPEVLSAGAGLALFSDVMGKKSSSATFTRALVGGTGSIPEAIEQRLGDKLVSGAHVSHVAVDEQGVRVSYVKDGRASEVRARFAVIAAPAGVAGEILDPRFTELKSALKSIKYGAFLAMAVFTDEVGAQDWDSLYAVATPGLSFDFVFNHASPLRTGHRRAGGSFMVFAGGPRAAEMIETLDDAQITERYLADLHRLLPGTKGHVVDTMVQRWPLGNIVATPGRARLQPILENGVPGDRVQLAGDYFAHLGGMEPATRTGIAAAERIRAAIAEETREPVGGESRDEDTAVRP